jgi:HSP20 family protein
MADTKKAVQKQESQTVDKTERTRSGKVFVPATDIIETENEILLMADMPGVNENCINITLENNQLTIEGSVTENNPKEHQLVYIEYEQGDFYRAFTLNDMIDREKIKANYQDGVLQLTLPKAQKSRSRQIAVQAE